MANFSDFDIEIQDEKDAKVEQINGSVTTAGSAVTVAPSSGLLFNQALIVNQPIGPNANAYGTYLTITVDDNTDIITIKRGGHVRIDGRGNNIKIDSNVSGAKFEVIFTVEGCVEDEP